MFFRFNLLGLSLFFVTSFYAAETSQRIVVLSSGRNVSWGPYEPVYTREEAAMVWKQVNDYAEEQRKRNGKHGLPQLHDFMKKSLK